MTLEPKHRPKPAVAQQILGPLLQTCYLQFAELAACLSAVMFALSLCFQLIAGDPQPGEWQPTAASVRTHVPDRL
jgi:hypothetical protein